MSRVNSYRVAEALLRHEATYAGHGDYGSWLTGLRLPSALHLGPRSAVWVGSLSRTGGQRRGAGAVGEPRGRGRAAAAA